jgi:hypothetical protein
MGWWFGRKSAPADVRPFVPAWLSNDSTGEGFARSREGMTATVRTEKTIASFRDGLWSVGESVAAKVVIGGKQVVGAQRPAVASPTGGTSVDSQCRDALSQLLTALRQHGLIAS